MIRDTDIIVTGTEDDVLDDFFLLFLLVLEHGGVSNLLLFGNFLQVRIDGFDFGEPPVQPVRKLLQMN